LFGRKTSHEKAVHNQIHQAGIAGGRDRVSGTGGFIADVGNFIADFVNYGNTKDQLEILTKEAGTSGKGNSPRKKTRGREQKRILRGILWNKK